MNKKDGPANIEPLKGESLWIFVRRIRVARGIPLKELGAQLDVDASVLSRAENGHIKKYREQTDPRFLQRLSAALDIPTKVLEQFSSRKPSLDAGELRFLADLSEHLKKPIPIADFFSLLKLLGSADT